MCIRDSIYIHRFQQQSDSGIELNLLQEYTFICLDIFDDIIRNEGRKIDGRLEEWLVFLKEDDPDMIIKLLEQNLSLIHISMCIRDRLQEKAKSYCLLQGCS